MRAYVAIMFSVMAVSVVFAQRPGGSDQRRQRQPMENRQRQPGGGGDAMLEPKASTGLIPLVDMGPDVFHHGEDGGLYGEGRNTPPEEHLRLAMKAASQIQPLDSQGRSIDSMVWSRQDYAGDGTHPSASGNRKVAEQMRAFFGADPTAVGWYSGSGQH